MHGSASLQYTISMKKQLTIFLIICFVLSFGSAGAFYFSGGNYSSIMGKLLASVYMLLPLVSVLVTQLICKEKPFTDCDIKFKLNIWWLIAWFGMLILPIIATVVSAFMPGVEFTLESDLMKKSTDALAAAGLDIGAWGFLGIQLVSALFAGATINALFAFGEEIAWRGFLPRVMAELGFWKKSLLIGVIWGFWHAPLILMGHNYPAHPVAGVFMMIAFCTLLSPLFMLFKDRSGSVVVVSIAHGTMNAIAGIALIVLTGYNDLLCGVCGLSGMLVLLVVDVVIFMTNKRSLVMMKK